MRKSVSALGAAGAALLATQVAQAHSFTCEKTVNDVTWLEVSSYPTTLHYELTATNSHASDASTAQSASDPALASLGFSFEPVAPFTLAVGGAVSDEFHVVLENADDCMNLAAADGIGDDRFVNVFMVSWDRGSAQCSATVVCMPPPPLPPEGGATRTPGFFKTHEAALSACLAEGAVDLGVMSIDSLEAALGLLWGSPAVDDTGASRSELDRARFLLARHTLVATCNVRLFDTQPEESDLIAQAVAALSGTDCELMHELAESADAFNNSGTEEDFPSGFVAGPATPRHAASIADDPTMPSAEQCGG